MADQIGTHQFVVLHRVDDPRGPPLGPREQCVPINRPGVDGTAVMRMGKRCDPFQMRAGVDALSIAVVPLAMRTYELLIGSDPVDIIWQGQSYGSYLECKWIVLDVVMLKSCRLSAKSGGLVTGATAWIETIWTLQAVLET